MLNLGGSVMGFASSDSSSASKGESVADTIRVNIPITRSDVIHPCDVFGRFFSRAERAVEDVAIAYGYNNIQRKQPPTLTTGAEQPINQLCVASRGNEG